MANEIKRKKFKRWLIYVNVYALVKIMRFLPRLAAVFVMRLLGRAVFLLIKSRRERTLQHLDSAYGREKSSAEINRIARQVFLNISTCAADAIRIPQIIGNGIDRMITIEGREHLDRISENGQGAILLTAHFGNWELLAAWIAKSGYKLKVVGAPNHDPRLDKLITDARNSIGYFNITRGSDTRDIIRGIRDGYFIGMLTDQDTKVDGVFVKFFDQWAHTAVGPVVLARRYGLKIVPVFMRLDSRSTYHIEVQEPLPLEFTENKVHDLLINTQKCSDAYERIIRKYPEQWVWMHRRWRKQPVV